MPGVSCRTAERGAAPKHAGGGNSPQAAKEYDQPKESPASWFTKRNVGAPPAPPPPSSARSKERAPAATMQEGKEADAGVAAGPAAAATQASAVPRRESHWI